MTDAATPTTPALQPGSLVWQLLFFPHPLAEAAALGLVRHWAAQRHAPQLILEARADARGVEYLVGSQLRHAGQVERQIESLVPGTLVVPFDPHDRHPAVTARRVELTSRIRPLAPTDREQSVRSILSSLTGLRAGERLTIQLVLGPRRRPNLPPQRSAKAGQGIASRVLHGVEHEHPDARQALVRKLGEHGFRAAVRLAVEAPTENRRKSLLLGLSSSIATVEAAGASLRLAPEKPDTVNHPRASWSLFTRSHHLSVPEVSYLTAWPITERDDPLPGQPPKHPKPLRPAPAYATGERIIGTASAPGTGTPVGYSVIDAMRHSWVLGPNGTGKSTLLLNLIIQDIVAGRPIVVIEPKDLVREILLRIPKERQKDVVLLDALDEAPVGINSLARVSGDTRSPELIADTTFGLFESLYGESLGPRSSDILRYALGALALRDDASLVMLPILLSNPGFRRSITQRAVKRDPIGAGSFWAWFDSLSPEAVSTITAPLSNKLRPLLSPTLRAVLGQTAPRFNARQVLTDNKILLVPLQVGVLGHSAAQLLAAAVLAELWQAIRERVAIPEASRTPVQVYIDEVQDFLRLPTNLADALATARSLRAGFTLAHQYGAQLPKAMHEAVAANARSRICFQLSTADARAMTVGQSVLAPEDFMSLPAYAVYAQLVRDNTVQPWLSAATAPPPRETSDPDAIRQSSREQYGQPLQAVEAAFLELLDPIAADSDQPATFGRKARRP
ncbi:type IV secretory system conjugative DNA transfer family protein [Tsukamurella tyrosinosolvens]|uniref:type IV secretory system conjugative DNA transfer family protein n=1 Tax=Tsukamurella tyrosinosolvens TaxID=57704 RepID=UPI001CE0FD72|nr:type IV secretory system conjugative DNA transfer family protein [Tsukamurella tyrosinosolvens]MCA4994231.1 type IV secretory system conjugative DNA transfer family protein [Tsukamurella tyrosinosolvens]